MVSASARRQQVEYATKRGLSCRRACALLSVARSGLGYRSRMADKDAAVIPKMKELAAQYPRYGYRRIRIFLGRDGCPMSSERMYRLWRLEKLQVPRRRPRRRVAASRPRPLPPTSANHVWAYDFVFDSCANGQQLKCLTVVGDDRAEARARDRAQRGRPVGSSRTRSGTWANMALRSAGSLSRTFRRLFPCEGAWRSWLF